MNHIWANEEYRSQLGATNRPENIVISYSPFKNQKTTNVAFSSIIIIGNAV
jgi:hypothetical protein